MNVSLNDTTPWPRSVHLPIVAYLAPPVYGVIFLVGFVGNSLVIYVVARFAEMRNVTNYFIMNLAVTDLAFLVFCVPFTAASYVLPSWVFGLSMCKFVNYMMQVTTQATCLTLTILSIDRYCAIVHPIGSLGFRKRRIAIVLNICTWIASFLLALPMVIYYKLVPISWYGIRTYCRPVWPFPAFEQGYMIYTVLITYFIPLVVCAVMCGFILKRLWSRFKTSETRPRNHTLQTRRISFMVIGVVVLFSLCWLPNHALNLWRMVNIRNKVTTTVYYLKIIALFLSYANSAVNPFVYTFVGENFRNCLRQMCQRRKDFTLAQKTKVTSKLSKSYNTTTLTAASKISVRGSSSSRSAGGSKGSVKQTSSNKWDILEVEE
ncbi:G-protein coupled receptor 54-like [Branchiostoma floridae]|uniref:G-protein coupled receptor 54-like n=2 Tax=Branchiostoma floridae TaxID=7739 RepID=A0A9J7LW45_BRAFL|nr:G-protein coupled receptor 54-like [Branchiostoma floridae]